MVVRIYAEGGGDTNKLQARCREGFIEFILKFGVKDGSFKVIACGSRDEAFKRFTVACEQNAADRFPVLLVDAEGPVAQGHTVWHHLQSRDKWRKPDAAGEEHAFLMVQCIEAWFLADVDCLQRFYKECFRTNAIPKRGDIENVPKQDAYTSLVQATAGCKQKGSYSKGIHSRSSRISILKWLPLNHGTQSGFWNL